MRDNMKKLIKNSVLFILLAILLCLIVNTQKTFEYFQL